MPSPQKAKGSGYERDVAKFLTELYGESFIRAPGSGAYVGGRDRWHCDFRRQLVAGHHARRGPPGTHRVFDRLRAGRLGVGRRLGRCRASRGWRVAVVRCEQRVDLGGVQHVRLARAAIE